MNGLLFIFIHQHQPSLLPAPPSFAPNPWRELAGRSTNVFPLAQLAARTAKLIWSALQWSAFQGDETVMDQDVVCFKHLCSNRLHRQPKHCSKCGKKFSVEIVSLHEEKKKVSQPPIQHTKKCVCQGCSHKDNTCQWHDHVPTQPVHVWR